MTSIGGQSIDASSTSNVEARDPDVEMRDASHDDNEGSDVDAEGEPEETGEEIAERGDIRQLISDVSNYLCEIEENGEELAGGFQRIPNRRVLPDYFEVISTPIAFSTVRNKLLRKLYTSFSEFVQDVAQICHNAQVYNRPSAPIFGAAVRLREVFQDKLNELASKGQITAEEAILPDLGELPPVDDSLPESDGLDDGEEEEEDEEEDDEEEEEEEEDSDDEGGRRRRGRRRRTSDGGRWNPDGDRDEDSHKKRGRPPSVLTPMEARIFTILKSLRKFKSADGSLLVSPFEKLPDKAVVPDYYQTITQPIALDHIKKKAKRKKYQTVDHVMADIELMFRNAMHYNEDDSPVHQAAVELRKQSRILAEEEKAKPDDDFRDEDGKLALASIDHKGEVWRVGDWVHIRNQNDLGKPIVAQLYRTWQDRDGQRWVNACWYYRPEQTVHRFDKHFFEHEVAKTGQYRDHQIEDVLDRCFVMFVTRFGRGRPRGLPADKAVYVCESRYNEERYTFNKIKTWASCVPDEVRDKDYEMDLFEVPRRMRKMPSPIKHLLREDAKDTDALPKPTWGSPSAPPIVGAVHRRPREHNESPPPEPEPPRQPISVPPELGFDHNRRSSMMSQPGAMSGTPGNFPASSPGYGQVPGPGHPTPQPHPHMTSHFQPVTPGVGLPGAAHTPAPVPQTHQHAPPHMQVHQVQYQQQRFPQQAPPSFSQPLGQMHHQHAQTPTYNQGYSQTAPSPLARPQVGPTPTNTAGTNMYNPPRPPEVYTLSDPINNAMPVHLRDKFQCDDKGRVLFFTAPPLERREQGISPSSAGLGHSAKYLAGRTKWLAEREKKRKARDSAIAQEARKRPSPTPEEKSDDDQLLLSQAGTLIENYFKDFDNDTLRWNKDTGLIDSH